jgi:hypothetical protein
MRLNLTVKVKTPNVVLIGANRNIAGFSVEQKFNLKKNQKRKQKRAKIKKAISFFPLSCAQFDFSQ